MYQDTDALHPLGCQAQPGVHIAHRPTASGHRQSTVSHSVSCKIILYYVCPNYIFKKKKVKKPWSILVYTLKKRLETLKVYSNICSRTSRILTWCSQRKVIPKYPKPSAACNKLNTLWSSRNTLLLEKFQSKGSVVPVRSPVEITT